MKIPFAKLNLRLTGISTPLVGAQWEFVEPEEAKQDATEAAQQAQEAQWRADQDKATRLLTYLEDRRILYAPLNQQMPMYGVESVLQIRQRLTADLEQLDASPLYDSVAAMRAACRKFLDEIQGIELDRVSDRFLHSQHLDSMIFFAALGSLRATFGTLIAVIAVHYQIDVEEELASILPVEP